MSRSPWLARTGLLLLFTAALVACGQSRVVKRESPRAEARRTGSPATGHEQRYRVRAGDTLYGIAFRHGLDFRDLAAWNRITAPYTIYPGQQLLLALARGQQSLAMKPRPAAAASARPGTAAPTTAKPIVASIARSRPSIAPSAPAAAGAPSVVAKVKPSTSEALVAGKAAPLPAAVAAVPATVPSNASGLWQWPTAGQIIGRYVSGSPTRQGIDIAGSAGQPVLAAADGVVVYSGTGLVGYGEVIIVKHSDEWLSAYGHNRRRLVAEGASVKAGQAIAELGRSGTSRDMLHFEIRRNGKAVDPQALLPAR